MSESRSEALELPPAAPVIEQQGVWRRRGATIAGIAVSGVLLLVLYRSLDMRLVGEALLRSDPVWLVVSVGMIVPITVLRAVRFFWVAPAGALRSAGEALRLTLVSSTFNVLLPAKTGDLTKSYFLARRSDTSAGVSIATVVYERLCDLVGLITWCLLAWVVGRPQGTVLPSAFWVVLAVVGAGCAIAVSSERAAAIARTVVAAALWHRKLRRLRDLVKGWPDLLRELKGRRRKIVALSLVLWLVHLLQMWMFTLALSVSVPLTVCVSLSAVALLAGQLPLTFAGLGTRDMALVILLSGYLAPESAAAMGILVASRGLLPPLVGLPMVRSYFAAIAVRRQQGRRPMDPAE